MLGKADRRHLATVVELLGEDAPAVAKFFVESERHHYVSRMHSVRWLAEDAAGLQTQWKQGFTAPDGPKSFGETAEERAIAKAKAFGGGLAHARPKDRTGRQLQTAGLMTGALKPLRAGGVSFVDMDYREGLPDAEA